MTMENPPEFLTSEECTELAENLVKKYRIAMNGRTFSVEASLKGKGVYVTVTLYNADHTFFYPVEARVMYAQEEMTPRDAALFLVDYIDTYFDEFLLEEDEELFLTIDWSDQQFDAVDFQIKGQILNRRLENLADEWLKKADGEERADI